MSPISDNYNAEKQRRYRERKRQAKTEQIKLIIDARLGMLNSQQRLLAVAVLSAVSDILNATTNQGSKAQ